MTSLTLRTRASAHGAELELAFDHPMESGLRTDSRGTTIPPLYLTEIVVEFEDRLLATLALGAVVSRNPVLTLTLPNDLGDGLLKAAWKDSSGDTGSRSLRLAAAATRSVASDLTAPAHGVAVPGSGNQPASGSGQ